MGTGHVGTCGLAGKQLPGRGGGAAPGCLGKTLGVAEPAGKEGIPPPPTIARCENSAAPTPEPTLSSQGLVPPGRSLSSCSCCQKDLRVSPPRSHSPTLAKSSNCGLGVGLSSFPSTCSVLPGPVQPLHLAERARRCLHTPLGQAPEKSTGIPLAGHQFVAPSDLTGDKALPGQRKAWAVYGLQLRLQRWDSGSQGSFSLTPAATGP